MFQGYGTGCDPHQCYDPGGACCIDGVCRIAMPWDCEEMRGDFQGGCTGCEPNPCPPANPAEDTSWGRIKARYR
jgi:hypothetical protein